MTANRSKIAFVSYNFRLFLKILQITNIKTTIGVCRELIQKNKNLHVLENFTVVILATSNSDWTTEKQSKMTFLF